MVITPALPVDPEFYQDVANVLSLEVLRVPVSAWPAAIFWIAGRTQGFLFAGGVLVLVIDDLP